jgi:hypothetical protein
MYRVSVKGSPGLWLFDQWYDSSFSGAEYLYAALSDVDGFGHCKCFSALFQIFTQSCGQYRGNGLRFCLRRRQKGLEAANGEQLMRELGNEAGGIRDYLRERE